MKLLKLRLKNFKGIKDFTLDLDGKNANIYGANASGKSSCFDGFLWLLFGKDSANRADFEIKTLDKDGQVLHGLDHEVEATLEIAGREIVLRKVYAEKYTKRRGEASKTFTGHTTDHWVDGVPVQKKEYDARVAEIAAEDSFRLLTNPRYFNDSLHWQDRRALLLEVCGDVEDEDVIASNKALAKLPAILGDRTLDDHRRVITARRQELNRELDKIPVRIDETGRNLPDVPKDGREGYENELKMLKHMMDSIERRRLRIESGGEIAEKQKELAEAEAELIRLQSREREAASDEMAAERGRLKTIEAEAGGLQESISMRQGDIEHHRLKGAHQEELIASLRKEWEVTSNREFTYVEKDACPTCGQSLPPDLVEEARAEALAEFNRIRSMDLELINIKGREAREELNRQAEAAENLGKQIERIEEKVATLHEEHAEVQQRIDAFDAEPVTGAKPDPAIAELKEKIRAIMDAIQTLRTDTAAALGEIDKEAAEMQARIDETQTTLDLYSDRERALARIEELSQEQKELAAEYERLEEELFLSEEFIRAKVAMLEDRINARFKHARFKLFNVLVNGAIEETAETLYQGVPYGAGLNNAAQIQVGCDIITTLQEHYDFRPVVWIDNRESVIDLPEMDCQVISLLVTSEDKKLRVEVEQ